MSNYDPFFSRSLRDSLAILDAFQRYGVELLIATAPELGSAATDKFLLNMMASFAEFERDMIRSRLADARAAIRSRGRRLAGAVPFGYDADPRTKQLVVNPMEARRVEAIFQMAADGARPSDIAVSINKLGWRTKVYQAWRSGRKRGGNLWTPRQVLDTLANPVYIGLLRDGARKRPGKHQPIIPRETWELVCRRIDDRHPTRKARGKKQPFWALRGRILCPHCDRMMSTHVTVEGNIVYRHYRCRSHAGGRPPCKGMSFPAYQIEKAVADTLADPAIADKAGEDRELLRRFQIAWGVLDFTARMRMLPEIVQQVVHHEGISSLAVTLDADALKRLFPEPSEKAETPPVRRPIC
jgi:site-specific DNA recombinase